MFTQRKSKDMNEIFVCFVGCHFSWCALFLITNHETTFAAHWQIEAQQIEYRSYVQLLGYKKNHALAHFISKLLFSYFYIIVFYKHPLDKYAVKNKYENTRLTYV